MRIVVTKRSHDYHTCIGDKPEIWGCGKDINSAIGDLIRSHIDIFEAIDLTIEYEKIENKESEILKAGCPVCLQEVDIYNDKEVLKIENHDYRDSSLQCPGSGDEVKW